MERVLCIFEYLVVNLIFHSLSIAFDILTAYELYK